MGFAFMSESSDLVLNAASCVWCRDEWWAHVLPVPIAAFSKQPLTKTKRFVKICHAKLLYSG